MDLEEKPSELRHNATRKRAQASPPLGALKRRSLYILDNKVELKIF